MNKKLLYSISVAAIIRILLSLSSYSKIFQDRIEISTPLNSFKRLMEGVYLYENSIDPYMGDIFHENPVILTASWWLLRNFAGFISFVYILLDLLTGLLIYHSTKKITKKNFHKQSTELSFAENIDKIRMQPEDLEEIPFYCALAYFFNPFSVLNCIGLTTTVWSNFLLSLMLYALVNEMKILCLLALALETQKNFYPVILIVPIALSLSESSKSKVLSRSMNILGFFVILAGIQFLSYKLMGSWKFLNSTYGFIIHCRDLTPNIGLFWYFFTEMFDHFRELFLYTFQLNTTILYLVPLTFSFKDSPEFLLTILLSLITIFRSYPCIGDVAFYLALIPLWKNVASCMSHNFIVIATFIVTSVLGPTVYHLWMYANSANANFYFGVTLVFCTANIFLLTDLCFAYLKIKFCSEKGVTIPKNYRFSLE